MNANDQNHRAILKSIAHRVMLERGLLPDFSSEALAELSGGQWQKIALARAFMRKAEVMVQRTAKRRTLRATSPHQL